MRRTCTTRALQCVVVLLALLETLALGRDLSGDWSWDACRHKPTRKVTVQQQEGGALEFVGAFPGKEQCGSTGLIIKGLRSGNGRGGVVSLQLESGVVHGHLSPDGSSITWAEDSGLGKLTRPKINGSDAIVTYVGEHHVIAKCKHGNFMLNFHDTYIARSLLAYGEWSERLLDLFLLIVKSGDIVLDIGANIGAFTIPLARAVGNHGLVHSFEPQHFVAQTLGTNILLNELDNVVVHTAAVSNFSGSIELPRYNYFHDANFGGISLRNQPQERDSPPFALKPLRFPMVTLDDTIRECPSFVKVDVEGMEVPVLQGASRMIMNCRPILFVENDVRDASKELILLLHRFQYSSFWSYGPYFSTSNWRGNMANVFGASVHEINMLAVPTEKLDQFSSTNRLDGLIPVRVDQGRFYLEEYIQELEELGFQNGIAFQK